ncbi:hypothetical protein Scep_007474 [Stephania cephalantha]|uniref:Uncharacterized protein n=1 Tax=Stephania cephalantha TaxID=152367 RepID=A0AAP0PLV0_9MAGN
MGNARREPPGRPRLWRRSDESAETRPFEERGKKNGQVIGWWTPRRIRNGRGAGYQEEIAFMNPTIQICKGGFVKKLKTSHTSQWLRCERAMGAEHGAASRAVAPADEALVATVKCVGKKDAGETTGRSAGACGSIAQ